MNLHESRKKIDQIDEQIVTLLNRRAAESKRIGLTKAAAGLPLIDEQRETEIHRRIIAGNGGEIGNDAIVRIFVQILRESRQIQSEIVTSAVHKGEIAK